MQVVEMRCPIESQRMFGKMILSGEYQIVESNLMEFACDRCRKRLGAKQVVHRFNIAGELVESEEDYGASV